MFRKISYMSGPVPGSRDKPKRAHVFKKLRVQLKQSTRSRGPTHAKKQF